MLGSLPSQRKSVSNHWKQEALKWCLWAKFQLCILEEGVPTIIFNRNYVHPHKCTNRKMLTQFQSIQNQKRIFDYMYLFSDFEFGRHGFTGLKPHWTSFKLVSRKCWDYRSKSPCTTIICDLSFLSNAEMQTTKMEKKIKLSFIAIVFICRNFLESLVQS